MYITAEQLCTISYQRHKSWHDYDGIIRIRSASVFLDFEGTPAMNYETQN